MKKIIALIASHLFVVAIGFAAGIYFLPILTAEAGPSATEINVAYSNAHHVGVFKKDLVGSDFLHWAEGKVAISDRVIAFEGSVAPGPDYKVYLTSEFVDSKAAFLKIKEQALRVGEVKTFDGFIVNIPQNLQPVDLSKYNTIVIWCEAYSQFISAAKFR